MNNEIHEQTLSFANSNINSFFARVDRLNEKYIKATKSEILFGSQVHRLLNFTKQNIYFIARKF
jgi:hypothetical protein